MQLHLIKFTFQVLDVSIPVELFIYDDTQKHSFNAFLDGEVAQLTSNSTALIREGRAWNFYFDSFIPEKFCVISIGKIIKYYDWQVNSTLICGFQVRE